MLYNRLFFVSIIFLSCNIHAKMKICTLELIKTLPQHNYSTNFLTQVYKNLGHEVEFLYFPNLRSIYSSNSGICDAELGRVGTDNLEKDYKNLLKVPTPYMVFPINLIYKKNAFSRKNFKGKTYKDLCQYAPAYPKMFRFVDQALKNCKIKFPVKNMSQAVELISSNRSQVTIIGNHNLLDKSIKNINLKKLTILSNVFQVKVFHYVHKKNKHIFHSINTQIKNVLKKSIP